MARAEKVERVAAIKERIGASDAILLTEYRGLTVSDISELRRSLAEGGASFAVVKNTLMRRAADDSAMAELGSLLEGPTAVAFVEGDPVAAAKKVVEAIKRFPSLVLKGGFMDGRMLSADDAKALADLESREVMLSKVAGLMKGEMSRAASMFQAAQSTFLSLLAAYQEKLPREESPVEAPAAEPEAPAAEEEAETPVPEEATPVEQAQTADETTDETTDAATPVEGEE
jgi:large subunit ribosomal protein L10